MSVQVRVDLTSGVPPYEQIRGQIVGHVSAGNLTPGDRLPTVRDLAADLGVAVGTVQRAYRELEAEGVVSTRRRVGTTITAATASTTAAPEVQRAAHTFVTGARAAGLSDVAILDLVRGALLSATS